MTPFLAENKASEISFSVKTSVVTWAPGKLIPLPLNIVPPVITLHITNFLSSSFDSTINWIVPSAIKSIEPDLTSWAIFEWVVGIISSSLISLYPLNLTISPSLIVIDSFNFPILIFGPCKSAKIETGFF